MLTLKLCLIFTLTCACLFFSIYLFISSLKIKEKAWLGATFMGLTLISSIDLIFYFPEIKNSISPYFGLLFYQKETLELITLPLFALYFLKSSSTMKMGWVHFTPAAMSLLFCLLYGLYSPNSMIDLAVCHRDVWPKYVNYGFVICQSIQIIYYFSLIFPVLRQHRYNNDITKGYRTLLFKVIFVSHAIYIVDYTLAIAFERELLVQVYLYVFYLFASLLAYAVLFLLESNYVPVFQSTQQITPKYAGSSLTIQNKELIMDQIKAYMETKQPYLNPEFTLENMAEGISILRTHISQVINEEHKMNFREYINTFRIKESIRLMKEVNQGNTMNINQIFYEAGFNSKSVFNTAFKKQTNLTPSEYRKRNMSAQNPQFA
jgi:AraC-like DNA-binding protein